MLFKRKKGIGYFFKKKLPVPFFSFFKGGRNGNF